MSDRPRHPQATTARAPQPQASRVEEAFNHARRHSGRVRVLKLGLPAAALLLVAAFVGKSWLATPLDVGVDISGTAIEGGRLVMADPKLEGFTSDKRAYKMTAERAIQDIGSQERIDLEGIDARLPFEKDSWMSVKAPTGTLDREANTLEIDSDITMVTSTGITALLKSATVDIEAGNLDTNDPVNITLDGTTIEADSLTVRDKGAVMVFERRVRVMIDAKRLQTASSQNGATNEN